MHQTLRISQVVEDGLCTGCGTCVSLCPNDAIELSIEETEGIYLPKLNEGKCINCGICYRICPGHEVNFNKLNDNIFNKLPENILIGNNLNCYTGHATDCEFRYNSASGGIATALLVYALDEGIIDGALVTKMKEDHPFIPEPFIARTKEEIIKARGSKYCPVPLNICLKEIMNSNDNEKFAFVGLPCHIHGLRKAEMINEKLKEKIILIIGIFCAHTDNFLATQYITQMNNINCNEINKIEYRGRGWPGSMQVYLDDKNKINIPFEKYIIVHELQLFNPLRCMMCYDGLAELADLSLGDAWIPDIQKIDGNGTSLIISRSDISETILHKYLSKHLINLERISEEKALKSQLPLFRVKLVNAFISTRKLINKRYPNYCGSKFELLSPSFVNYGKLSIFLMNKHILSKKPFWKLSFQIIFFEKYILRKILDARKK